MGIGVIRHYLSTNVFLVAFFVAQSSLALVSRIR